MSAMFTIRVEHTIAAAHAISIAGAMEPLHGHNWRVQVTVESSRLDSDGLVCDFHTVHESLLEVLQPFDNRNFNDVRPFGNGTNGTINPTAERIAEHVGKELVERLGDSLAPDARIAAVSVTEAPGCVATYVPGR